MLVYFSCSHYVSFSGGKESNNGTTKPEQSIEPKEMATRSAKYNQLGNNVFIQFKDFLQLNPVPEYKIEEVKRETNVIQWY
jgi:hypothetical protein